jgi:hypothetical protein
MIKVIKTVTTSINWMDFYSKCVKFVPFHVAANHLVGHRQNQQDI